MSLEQGSGRSVLGERLQEEHATGRRSKRRKLREVEALRIKDSVRWELPKRGSRRRRLRE